MAKHPDEQTAIAPNASVETDPSLTAWLKLIDNTRKGVALTFVACGVGLFYFSWKYRNYWPREGADTSLARSLDVGFAVCCWIGVFACLALTLVLIVEPLARPTEPARFGLRNMLIRMLVALLAFGVLGFSMYRLFGPWQAIGSTVGAGLALAAVRVRNERRIIPGFFAAIMLGLTVLSTQSTYQYARWHTDEIVAAGCELIDACPEKGDSQQARIDGYEEPLFSGQAIEPSDPRVPDVLRKLGAQRIVLDRHRVIIYAGFDETEFQILRDAESGVIDRGGKGGELEKFTDRLWSVGNGCRLAP